MLQLLELARTGVHETVECDGLHLAETGEVEVAGRAGVVEDRRREQHPARARRDVRRADPGGGVLAPRLALVERRPVDDRAPVVPRLVEHDVAGEVLVAEHDARVVAAECGRERAVRALVERLDRPGREVAAPRVDQRLRARLDREVGEPAVRVDLDQVRACVRKRLRRDRLGKAAVDRDEERLVVLVAVVVEHHDDAIERGQHAERLAADQLRVLERDLRRQQRLGDAARGVHRVEAEPAREVRDEVEPAVGQLWRDEEARREQRFDAIRGRLSPGQVRRSAQGHYARPYRFRPAGNNDGASNRWS